MVEVKVKVILKVIDEVRAKVISSKCGKMGVVLSLFASTTINVCINVIGIQINTKKRSFSTKKKH